MIRHIEKFGLICKIFKWLYGLSFGLLGVMILTGKIRGEMVTDILVAFTIVILFLIAATAIYKALDKISIEIIELKVTVKKLQK